MNDAQKLGAALMEANAVHIKDVAFRCTVSGKDLRGIGEEAWKECRKFYGKQTFEIDHIDVEAVQLNTLETIAYEARVSARVK